MFFFVKTLTGKIIIIEASPYDTIQKIKDMISKKEKIPAHQQKLKYTGEWLQNDKKLTYYMIKNDSTLQLLTGIRGMRAEEEDTHLNFINKSGTKTIKLDSYHICDKSDTFDGSDMIGIILYQYDGESKWELNGIECKCGDIYLCKTDNLKGITSAPINTKHARCYKKLFNEDPDYTKIVGAACAYFDNRWKYNSSTFNAPNQRYKIHKFKDEWHDNNREMHPHEHKWLQQTIDQWISSDFVETKLYVTYVTWSWWKDGWRDYDKETNNYIETEYAKYMSESSAETTYSINLNSGYFAKDEKLSDKYKIYFSAPNICMNPQRIHSRNYSKWRNDKDQKNKYFLQENYVKVPSHYRIVRRRNMNETLFWYQSCVCL